MILRKLNKTRQILRCRLRCTTTRRRGKLDANSVCSDDAEMSKIPSRENAYLFDHANVLMQSYAMWLGHELVDSGLSSRERAQSLFEAPFVVVSHDTQDDPVFNYGNRTALELFEMDWESFTQLPSRHSAEMLEQHERSRLLAAVTRQNFIDDYSGVRITATGRRFYIPKATVWNLVDEGGVYRGQAATFHQWQFIS